MTRPPLAIRRREVPAHGPWPDTVDRPATLHLLRPDPGLHARLGADGGTGTTLHVIDPNGFVVLRYPAGFDAAGLHADLKRLVKLK